MAPRAKVAHGRESGRLGSVRCMSAMGQAAAMNRHEGETSCFVRTSEQAQRRIRQPLAGFGYFASCIASAGRAAFRLFFHFLGGLGVDFHAS